MDNRDANESLTLKNTSLSSHLLGKILATSRSLRRCVLAVLISRLITHLVGPSPRSWLAPPPLGIMAEHVHTANEQENVRLNPMGTWSVRKRKGSPCPLSKRQSLSKTQEVLGPSFLTGTTVPGATQTTRNSNV